MAFGQLVIGPPGSGKTTYCNGMQQYMQLVGRKVAVINLDPANDALPYDCAVDLADLVSLEEVQKELGLGPNGGLVYCIDYLEQNLDWLQEKLDPLVAEGCYLLFDLPGQVELFTLHASLKRILQVVTDQWNYRLATVHLVDAHLCADPAKYLAALLLALGAMLHLGLPHVNLLSKADLVEQYGELAFALEYYTEVQDPQRLAAAMPPGRFSQRFRKLSQALCEVVEDYGLVHFLPLVIQEKDSVQRALAAIDKANGYAFAGLAGGQSPYPPEFIYGAGLLDEGVDSYQERYMGSVQERMTTSPE